MFTIATIRHSGSHIVQSIELSAGAFFFRSTPPATWNMEETRREVPEAEARDTLLVWRDLACEGGELTVLHEDQLLMETHFGARHLEMLVGEAPQQWEEEHVPNEEGTPPAPYDPEAQADLELHNALHPDGYGR